jgi:hypothetical protein
MNAELKAELLKKYKDTKKPSVCIRPAAKGKEAIKALLNKEEPEVIEMANSKLHQDMLSGDRVILYEDLANMSGLSVMTIRSRAKKVGLYKKGSLGIDREYIDKIDVIHRRGHYQAKGLTKEQDLKIRELYEMDDFEDRTKKPEDTILYWAKKWGISRSSIWRRAKELGVTKESYKKTWTKSEEIALKRFVVLYPFALISDKMVKAGFMKRSEHSIRAKIRSLGIKQNPNEMKIRTIPQEALVKNTTSYYVLKNSNIVRVGKNKYVVA